MKWVWRQPLSLTQVNIQKKWAMPFFWGHFVILIWDSFVGPWYSRNHFNGELPGWFNKYNICVASFDPFKKVFWKGGLEYKDLVKLKRRNNIPWYVPVATFTLKDNVDSPLRKEFWHNYITYHKKIERRVDACIFLIYQIITHRIWVLCWKLFMYYPFPEFFNDHMPWYYIIFLYWWFFECKCFRLTCCLFTCYVFTGYLLGYV